MLGCHKYPSMSTCGTVLQLAVSEPKSDAVYHDRTAHGQVHDAMSLSPIPPLLGNKQGQFKIRVIGNSGTGKSTLSAQLSEILRIPVISADKLFWKPNWVRTPDEEFRNSVREAMDQNSRGWIFDGDYSKILGEAISEEATDIIWLDPPLLLYFPRLFLRSMARIFGLVAICSPGCLETHWVVRKSNEKLVQDHGIGVGRRSDEQKMRRIGGWGSELRKWLEDVQLVFRSAPAI